MVSNEASAAMNRPLPSKESAQSTESTAIVTSLSASSLSSGCSTGPLDALKDADKSSFLVSGHAQSFEAELAVDRDDGPELHLNGGQSTASHKMPSRSSFSTPTSDPDEPADRTQANSSSMIDIQEEQQQQQTCERKDTGHREPQANSKKSFRLRTTSKTILLFKRAKSSLTHSNSAGNGNNNNASCQSLALSSLNSWRRETTTTEHVGSVDGSAVPSNSAVARAKEFFLRGSRSGSSSAGQHRPASDLLASSATPTCLPQFIVPRMNALKLPIVCLIKSIDGSQMQEIFVHRYELGQYLLDSLKVSLDINESKYFGLKLAKNLDEQDDIHQPWLELGESVFKQINKNKQFVTKVPAHYQLAANSSNEHQNQAKSVDLYLRIKFYPPNITHIRDSFTRDYLWMQLRRDLRLGKLTSSMNNLTLLMAYILQFELGNYSPELTDRVASMNVMPNQDLFEDQAVEIWKSKLLNLKRHQVQMQFLRAACTMIETYGFDYYPVRDHQKQKAYLLGFNYAGIKTIRNGKIIHHFRWFDLSKVTFERRMIIFHIHPNKDSKRKQILGFKCLSNDDCHILHIRLLEQKYFFTVDLVYFDKSICRPSCLESADVTDNTWPYESNPPEVTHLARDGDQQAVRFEGRDVSPNNIETAQTSTGELTHHISNHEAENRPGANLGDYSAPMANGSNENCTRRREFYGKPSSSYESQSSSYSFPDVDSASETINYRATAAKNSTRAGIETATLTETLENGTSGRVSALPICLTMGARCRTTAPTTAHGRALIRQQSTVRCSPDSTRSLCRSPSKFQSVDNPPLSIPRGSSGWDGDNMAQMKTNEPCPCCSLASNYTACSCLAQHNSTRAHCSNSRAHCHHHEESSANTRQLDCSSTTSTSKRFAKLLNIFEWILIEPTLSQAAETVDSGERYNDGRRSSEVARRIVEKLVGLFWILVKFTLLIVLLNIFSKIGNFLTEGLAKLFRFHSSVNTTASLFFGDSVDL